MEYITFDFETATNEPSSACSLALIHYRNGAAIDQCYRLFQPPAMKFDDDNIRIHQIRPQDVENKPSFHGAWADFLPYFEMGIPLFAHNAKFDIGVLRASLAYYGMSLPHFRYGCTLQLARRAFLNLPSYALNRVGEYLGLTFHHHQADEDAAVCSAILERAAQDTGINDLDALYQHFELTMNEFQAEDGLSPVSLF